MTFHRYHQNRLQEGRGLLAPPPILIISGPSGVGKSTQIKHLLAADSKREFLVSYTTRMPRPEETNDVDYHFLVLDYLLDENGKKIKPQDATATQVEEATENAKAAFLEMEQKHELLFESTSFNGHYYGTPRKQLEAGLANGKQMLADVNLEGVKAFRAAYPHKTHAFFITTEESKLRERLIARDITPHDLSEAEHTEKMQIIESRMALAKTVLAEAEAEYNDAPAYDAVIESADHNKIETTQRLLTAMQKTRAPLNRVAAPSVATAALRVIAVKHAAHLTA